MFEMPGALMSFTEQTTDTAMLMEKQAPSNTLGAEEAMGMEEREKQKGWKGDV